VAQARDNGGLDLMEVVRSDFEGRLIDWLLGVSE
jgi:hypothetical protein